MKFISVFYVFYSAICVSRAFQCRLTSCTVISVLACLRGSLLAVLYPNFAGLVLCVRLLG